MTTPQLYLADEGSAILSMYTDGDISGDLLREETSSDDDTSIYLEDI